MHSREAHPILVMWPQVLKVLKFQDDITFYFLVLLLAIVCDKRGDISSQNELLVSMKSWRSEIWGGSTLIEAFPHAKAVECTVTVADLDVEQLFSLSNFHFSSSFYVKNFFMIRVFSLLLLRMIHMYSIENFKITVFSVQKTEIDAPETMPSTIKSNDRKNLLAINIPKDFSIEY